ncbi:hypothetical protein CLV46_2492 [Diaminobutyricimonas aerilata]|uniref:Uncharacterized protein n=1 Tax=Diaminobutyricimonas aerilata TaxID=1162967 RepID=A0A2M9CLZ3_9MICO|nr:hypothetical protein [Diaminobutyricimonas aerilata]PJJ72913.1 hypothetical protein CLV46_2492 [Diaminobutyricimonas aerilata]
MRRIYYANGSVLTDDMTCKALLRYARALAEADLADVVQVPIRQEDGAIVYSHFLIGPASQIFSNPVGEPNTEPFDAAIIEKLESATARLHPARPDWSEEMTDVPDLDMPSFS